MPDTIEDKLPLEFEAEVVDAAAENGSGETSPVMAGPVADDFSDQVDDSGDETKSQAGPSENPPALEEKVSLLEKVSTIPTWKKITAVAAWMMAVVFLSVLVANLRSDPAPEANGIALPVSEVQPEPIPEGSLGVALGDIRAMWNAVDQPPTISTPIRRLLEPGELDSFLHRFDTGAELVGAYPDNNDYLVALMVRANLKDPAAEHMYLHMCHVISPFSPECIQNYRESGLDGQTWEEVVESGTDVSWVYDDNTWQMTIEGSLLTIRVLAPESS